MTLAREATTGAPDIVRINPTDGTTVLGSLQEAGVTGVDRAVTAAAAAQAGWASTPVADRALLLALAADAAEAQADQLANTLANELGKPINDSRAEVRVALALIRQMAEEGPAHLSSTEEDDARGRLRVLRQPYGVVAAIVPWNAPLVLAATKVGPAVLAGNAIVVKPSPVAAAAVTALLEALGSELPTGLVGVVQGDRTTGAALVAHPGIRRIAFTGGEAAGAAVMVAAAPRAVPVSLELGGNDAAIVLPDAPFSPELFKRAVLASFRTSGQVCMAAKRWYVHRSVLDTFVDGFIEAARTHLVVGDPLLEETTMGPVATSSQRDFVRDLIDDAAARGATVVELGTVPDPAVVDGPGTFLRPTLLIGVDDDWPVARLEQFGPVAPVLVFDDVDDAVRRANASDLGLGSSVWTADEDQAFSLAGRLEAGYTFVNTHNLDGVALRAPFGGVKGSGFGREFGPETVLEYTATHTVHMPAHAREAQS
ncbi:aldehyde dehydrogenase family protein [Nocardioides luteus]|uniref:aldehyde dehydrogenase family protein n=1 Tax=Nocardioides luteus TaxID=1844 RepID=UPI0018CADE96|nr:aldehyde dehydrogenase family protein [Nocardioides luteus]MBG6095475.1 acyl-CoA reductase-like NAD-dependent aldehyde dehydrogenase [Nocardioides luteus]